MLFDKLDRPSRSKNRRNRSFPRSRPPIVPRSSNVDVSSAEGRGGKKGKSIDEVPPTSVVRVQRKLQGTDRVARFQTLKEGGPCSHIRERTCTCHLYINMLLSKHRYSINVTRAAISFAQRCALHRPRKHPRINHLPAPPTYYHITHSFSLNKLRFSPAIFIIDAEKGARNTTCKSAKPSPHPLAPCINAAESRLESNQPEWL